MNYFDLSTDEKKLETIISLTFSYTLASLEHYLNLTNWLRQFIIHFASISKPLQNRKTELLAKAPRAKSTTSEIHDKDPY